MTRSTRVPTRPAWPGTYRIGGWAYLGRVRRPAPGQPGRLAGEPGQHRRAAAASRRLQPVRDHGPDDLAPGRQQGRRRRRVRAADGRARRSQPGRLLCRRRRELERSDRRTVGRHGGRRRRLCPDQRRGGGAGCRYRVLHRNVYSNTQQRDRAGADLPVPDRAVVASAAGLSVRVQSRRWRVESDPAGTADWGCRNPRLTDGDYVRTGYRDRVAPRSNSCR